MATVASENKVQELYIAYFGRPADPEGLAFYADALDAETTTIEAIATSFGASTEAAPIVALSTDDYLAAVYLQAFARAYDTAVDGTFWADAINSGATTKELAMIQILEGAQGDDALAVVNKVAVASTYTAAVETENKTYGTDDIAAAQAVLSDVTSDSATVATGNTAAAAAVDDLDDAGDVVTPPVEGSTFVLTDGRDNLTGTDNDDTFYGDVGQNQNGAVANAFSTGDIIDGGGTADTDKIIATVINDNEVDGDDANIQIHARTSNIEEVYLEVIGEQAVTVDAGRMNSVVEYWSDNSDSDLIITDVRLGDKLSITKEITFGLRDVDFETDFTAQFDSLSLTNEGQVTSNSQVLIRVADVSTETIATPLLNVDVTIGFTLDATAYVLENVRSADGTYEGLRQAIANEIDNIGLEGLTVTFGGAYTSVTAAGNTVSLPFTAQEILVTDVSGSPFSSATFAYQAIAPIDDEFLVVGNASAVDPTSSSTLIETNLELDNAGRGSTAGDVLIGAMSNSDAGVELINVAVNRDSAIDSLGTTNAKLQQVVVTSLTADGDLEIGELDDNVLLFNANAFEGTNLMLGTTVELTDDAVENLHVFNSTGAANNTLVANITEADGVDSDTFYSYNSGIGNDTYRVTIDGDAVDADAEAFAINASSGNNTISVELDAGVSQATMALLSNLDIVTTSGTDSVTNRGIGNFDISTGGDNDFVYMKSVLETNTAGASVGGWTVSTTTGAATFVDRVLYEATITVSFAGFESTVTVDTDAAGNFVANQLLINTAIKAAIAANVELNQLLTATDSTGSEQLVIASTVEGLDELSITLFQPTLVTSGATGTQVNFVAGDLAAMQAGIIATTANDSDATDTAAEVVAIVNGLSDLSAGNLTATGVESATLFAASAAGATADETTVINHSTIDMGTGSNDLLVLNSHDSAASTVEFTADWGKVSIKNFFTDGAVGGTDGVHILDFTTYLDDQIDVSTDTVGDTQSAVRVATSDVAVTALAANTVATTSFTTLSALDGNATNTFSSITDAEVLTALQANATYGTAGATANLVGTTRDSVLFVENNLNLGEYKIYNVDTSNIAATDATGITAVNLMGVIDFGASIDITAVVFA